MATLVVGRDGNVDELGRRVRVAEGNDGDVDVGSLLDGLGVGAGVGDNDQAGLLEGSGDVVGERTGGETTGNGLGAGVGGELEDGTLTVRTSGDDTDVGGVVDSGDDASGQDNLLPIRGQMSEFLFFFSPPRSSKSIVARKYHVRVAIIHIPGLANVDNVDTVGTNHNAYCQFSFSFEFRIQTAPSWSKTYRVLHR